MEHVHIHPSMFQTEPEERSDPEEELGMRTWRVFLDLLEK